MTNKCVLVGAPGCGKTQLFRRVISRSEGPGDHFREGSGPGVVRARISLPETNNGASPAGKWILFDTPGLREEIGPAAAQRAAAHTLRLVISSDMIVHVVDAARVGRLGRREGLREIDAAIRGLAQDAPWDTLRRATGGAGGGENGAGERRGLLSAVLRVGSRPRGDGRGAPSYVLAASKMDLPLARVGLQDIRGACPGITVLPLSGLRGDGVMGLLRHMSDRPRRYRNA